MTTPNWILSANLLAFLLLSSSVQAASIPPELTTGNNKFAWELYAELAESPGNLVFSPQSISSALAMTFFGAEGETSKQIAKTLHFELPPEELAAGYAALLSRFQNAKPGQESRLLIANRLWGQSGYEFRPEFLQMTREFFGSELGEVDFSNQTQKARTTINQWVADKTEGHIENLLSPQSVNSQTRLVLTNAVYFFSGWKYEFRKGDTQPAAFAVSPRESVNVSLMTQTNRLRYAKSDGVQILELPYQTGGLSMVVLLPKTSNGLAALDQGLSAKQVNGWMKQLELQQVEVFLPKFKLDSSFELQDVLSTMGMPIAFEQSQADFTGIEASGEIYLSAVIHKVFIDVNEQGTEAAAATAVVGDGSPAPRDSDQPNVFRADHPFVYLIRDQETGSVLFIGRVSNPNE